MGLIIFVVEMTRAPLGYENDTGFHFGKEPVKLLS